MPDLYSSPETPLQISLQGNCHGYDLSHMLLYYDSRISPGCERQPKWLRQKAMVMTYARCSYLPTDIFPSILARFPQSGYERMRPQSQCASRQDAPQFVMRRGSAPCSTPLPWECNDCRNPTFLYRFFKCWIWNSISRCRAWCTNIHVEE